MKNVIIDASGRYSREYHVKMELVERSEDSRSPYCGEIARTIGRFRGVALCCVHRYSIMVFKGEMWSWEEVEAELLPFLEAMTASPEAGDGQ